MCDPKIGHGEIRGVSTCCYTAGMRARPSTEIEPTWRTRMLPTGARFLSTARGVVPGVDMSHLQQIWRWTKRDKACVTSDRVMSTLHLLTTSHTSPIQPRSRRPYRLSTPRSTWEALRSAQEHPISASSHSPTQQLRGKDGSGSSLPISANAVVENGQVSVLVERQPFRLCIS